MEDEKKVKLAPGQEVHVSPIDKYEIASKAAEYAAGALMARLFNVLTIALAFAAVAVWAWVLARNYYSED